MHGTGPQLKHSHFCPYLSAKPWLYPALYRGLGLSRNPLTSRPSLPQSASWACGAAVGVAASCLGLASFLLVEEGNAGDDSLDIGLEVMKPGLVVWGGL